jgi:hypothetical protein
MAILYFADGFIPSGEPLPRAPAIVSNTVLAGSPLLSLVPAHHMQIKRMFRQGNVRARMLHIRCRSSPQASRRPHVVSHILSFRFFRATSSAESPGRISIAFGTCKHRFRSSKCVHPKFKVVHQRPTHHVASRSWACRPWHLLNGSSLARRLRGFAEVLRQAAEPNPSPPRQHPLRCGSAP